MLIDGWSTGETYLMALGLCDRAVGSISNQTSGQGQLGRVGRALTFYVKHEQGDCACSQGQ